MKICVLLPYANPHTTGWIDEFIKITNHEVVVGIVHSVKKYRHSHFEEADNIEGYLYFFKDYKYKKLFYKHLRECTYMITLGIFEPWFFKTIFSTPKLQRIFVVSEPFRPGTKTKSLLRKVYVFIVKCFKSSSKFSFLCMGGQIVKDQYLSFGFANSRYYQFGHFPPLHQKQKRVEDKISHLTFIFVGKLIPRKGIDILVSTIKFLRRSYTNWQFLIVGDGELKSELLKNIDGEHGIQYFENISDAATMKSKFDDSHVLFLPSYFDGWGAVVNEALSSSCSLLLSENVYAGVALLVNGENGFSFSPYQIDNLHSIIEKYFSDTAILNKHFIKSAEIFEEWNHKNAAFSFDNFVDGKPNLQNQSLLTKI
jgi:glycosyltransferase involved in cell wall biosynthesis